MKVEGITLPKPSKRFFHEHQRCSKQVTSSGTNHFTDNTYQCGRFAVYLVDGVALCSQHAGAVALKFVIDKQGGKS